MDLIEYFEDKKDLFLYLMALIGEEKINYLSPIMGNPDDYDFFTLMRELFLSGIQFASAHPRYVAIGNMLLLNKEAPVYKEMKGDLVPSAEEIYKSLLEKAVARGEVRSDIDVKLISYLMTSMNMIIVEYYSETHPQGFTESMIETVDTFMDILKNGIGEGD